LEEPVRRSNSPAPKSPPPMKVVDGSSDPGQSRRERQAEDQAYTEAERVVVTRRRRRRRKPKINKAEKIREVAKNLVARGKPPRPVEIVEILAAEGVAVLSSQVSMALRGTGMELRPRRPRQPSPPEVLPDPTTLISQVSLDDLLLVREFIKKIGTYDNALAAVIAYRHLGMEGVKQHANG
jgi:hypothetical protein